MDTGRLCMFCMEDNEGQSVCPHCGRDANAPLIKNHLKPGEILGGRFLVGRAVGQDASGVVYIVYDLRKERALRIREYLPRGVAMRAKGMGADVIVTEIDPIKALEASMDGCRVMPMDEAAKQGDIFITTTGCRDVITERHFAVMKNNAFLSNAGHFNVEVNGEALEKMAVRVFKRRNDIVGYELPDGRVLNLLAEGRLVNLASGNGHPAEIMDTSFSVQALSLEYMLRNGAKLDRQVYEVPKEIDDAVSLLKLKGAGLQIDHLTDEQIAYLSGWQV